MSGAGTLEFEKQWSFFRATDLPSLPPCLVSDDLTIGSEYYGQRVGGYARYQIAPPPFIPGRAFVVHAAGHDVQFDVSERTGNVDAWIRGLFEARGAPLPTTPDARTKDAHALMVEQACSLIPEAFFGEWGGYRHALYDNINDPVGAAQKSRDWFNSPESQKVRDYILNYRNWVPANPVTVTPPVNPDPVVNPLPLAGGIPTATLRYCFDSITARDIPAGAEIVAGYIDGAYAWAEWDWASFPNAVKVRIAVYPATNDGHVLDVEPGDATPDQAVGWVQMRRAAGADPTVYTGIGQWDAVRAAFRTAGVAEPHYWIAHYDNDPTPIPGAIAKQYANPTFTGHHYDASVVGPGKWPGVEEDMTQDEFNKWFDARYSENAEQVNTTKALKDAVKVLNDRLDKLKAI